MNFDRNLTKALLNEIAGANDIKGSTADSDPLRYSRILFMLADIRREYLQGIGPDYKVPDELKPEKMKLIQKAMVIVDAASKDGILDYHKAADWFYSSIPGLKLMFQSGTLSQDEFRKQTGYTPTD